MLPRGNYPREFIGRRDIMADPTKAGCCAPVTEGLLRRIGPWRTSKLRHGVDNLADGDVLAAATRGLALMPAYARNLLPPSVISAVEGDGTDESMSSWAPQSLTRPDPEVVPVAPRRTGGTEPEV